MIRRLLLWWLRYRIRPEEFSFPSSLARARRVLILMPSSREALRQVEYFLSRVPRVFPRAKVTLVYPPRSIAATFYNPYGFDVVVPAMGDVGFTGWPRGRFVKKLFTKPFDVVITLDKEPTLFFAALLVKSKTQVRIGLPGGLGMPFTSVELRPARQGADPKTEFILFIEMIRKFIIPAAQAKPTGGMGVSTTS